MSESTRRAFIEKGLATTGAISAASMVKAVESVHSDENALPRRVLGRTKERVTLLGLGVAPLGSDKTSLKEAEAIVQAAIDHGIRYVDVSPDYGNAEAKLKAVLKTQRDGVFLVTKVNPDRQDKSG